LTLGMIVVGAGTLTPPSGEAVPARPQQAAAVPQPPPVDLHGDPLPPGAVARLGTVRFRAGTGVSGVAFSPDGKLLAVGTGDGSLVLTEVSTGRQLRRVPLGGHGGHRVVFMPDGRRVCTAPFWRGGELRLWDVTTGKEAGRLEGFRGTAVV